MIDSIQPETVREYLSRFLQEDIGPGDYSALACLDPNLSGESVILLKDDGVLAGLEFIQPILELLDPDIEVSLKAQNGTYYKSGQVLAHVSGNSQAMLSGERTVLNLMQRMSGIATKTYQLNELIKPHGCRLLDTRKTAPGLRYFDKLAVATGGGVNHRYGLFDMVMIKDNHIDHAGGISKAIENCVHYLKDNNLSLNIEVETRNMEEVEQVMKHPEVFRILLDNFSPQSMREAVRFIDGKKETEASGGITEDSIESYARTGVDYISVGALTHSVKSLDISMKHSK
ncbi:MAG: carboxylating nicotinate-nucleotide diphosphorylase [Luteibaculum sp.]